MTIGHSKLLNYQRVNPIIITSLDSNVEKPSKKTLKIFILKVNPMTWRHRHWWMMIPPARKCYLHGCRDFPPWPLHPAAAVHAAGNFASALNHRRAAAWLRPSDAHPRRPGRPEKGGGAGFFRLKKLVELWVHNGYEWVEHCINMRFERPKQVCGSLGRWNCFWDIGRWNTFRFDGTATLFPIPHRHDASSARFETSDNSRTSEESQARTLFLQTTNDNKMSHELLPCTNRPVLVMHAILHRFPSEKTRQSYTGNHRNAQTLVTTGAARLPGTVPCPAVYSYWLNLHPLPGVLLACVYWNSSRTSWAARSQK